MAHQQSESSGGPVDKKYYLSAVEEKNPGFRVKKLLHIFFAGHLHLGLHEKPKRSFDQIQVKRVMFLFWVNLVPRFEIYALSR